MLELFDCFASCGMPMNAAGKGAETFGRLKSELADAGISGALVFRREAAVFECGGVVGNPLIAADMTGETGNFFGIWSILPSGSPEFPEPQDLPEAMRRNRIAALRLSPKVDNFPQALWAVDDTLALAQERRIPVYINSQEGVTDALLGDILQNFPALPVVFCWYTVWSGDRWFRALLRRFSNVYLELSHVHVEGFYEDFIQRFGHERLLFASGWPEYYAGGAVLNLLHARITEEAREAVGSGNMMRLLKEARLG